MCIPWLRNSNHSSTMEGRALKFLFFVLLAAQVAVSERLNGNKDLTLVKVGVIVDRNTLVGKMCWASISMAIDDFYDGHPNISARLVLHLRDGRADVVGAGSAALGLVNKEGVLAILGPQKSGQAKFLSTIAGKAQVPIITFSATSPFLSSSSTPYLLRMSINDSAQVTAIASVIAHYGWREVSIIYEDTDYGNGVIPFLIDALQDNSVRLTRRVVIPLTATDDQITDELSTLKMLKNRVFIVHLSLPLGERLFAKATDREMVTTGYAWIVTDGIASLVNSLDSKVIKNMQGFLGVKPHVERSADLDAFIPRWRRRYRRENPEDERIEPHIFSLWAYDAAKALALAVEKVKVKSLAFKKPRMSNNSTDLDSIPTSESGPAIIKALEETDFKGLSGYVRLVNGQLQSSKYQIINVVGNGQKSVGNWSSGKNKVELGAVIWPGDTSSVPKGWEEKGKGGKMLRVGVPVKEGFFEFVKFEVDPIDNQTKPTGYSIEIFKKVMSSLPYDVPYDIVPYTFNDTENNGTSGSYDKLVQTVEREEYDAVAGDITIRENRFQYVDFTMPYTDSSVYIIVPLEADNKSDSFFVFMEPLTLQLWLCSLAFFLLTGFTVWVIESMENNEHFGGPLLHVIINVLYFSFSTAVFAHKQDLRSGLSKMVVTVWVFAVLIITSTYTANLASILTAAKLRPAFTNMEEVVKNGQPVGFGKGSFLESHLRPIFGSRLIPLSGYDEFATAFENGTVSSVFHELPYIRLFLKKYCKGYTMVGPTHRTAGFGFGFRKGSPLLSDVSKAVVAVTQGPAMDDIERKWMLANNTSECKQDEDGGSHITLHRLRGLFFVIGFTFSLALIIAFVVRLLRANSEEQLRSPPIIQDEVLELSGELPQTKTPNEA
ncbi:glutamate receptor 2.7-like [Wolffia australiana]